MRSVTVVTAFVVACSLPAQPLPGTPIRNNLTCVSRAGNPYLELWGILREALEGKDGNTNAGNLKGANLPLLPATVLAIGAGELLVSIADGKTPEAVIRLTAPWRFARTPFRLTMDVDPAKVTILERSKRAEGEICRCYPLEEIRRGATR